MKETLKRIIPKNFYDQLRTVKFSVERFLFRFFWLFPVDRYKIVFSNFNGKGYGDNPKYIAEEMEQRNLGKKYWLTKDMGNPFPEYINPVKYGSLGALYHVATARLWIDNNRKEPYVVKRKKQYYVQTWHGSIALKKIEKDAENSMDWFYENNAKRDAKMTDLMISDSAFSEHLYGCSFWYEGEIARVGTPRLDPLFDRGNERIRDKLVKDLKIPSAAYIVLYAPTFRNNPEMNVYDLDLALIKSAFEQKMHRDVFFLVRMHPHISKCQLQLDSNLARDVSEYPDVYELMKCCDAFISDYSSLIFEFPIAEPKPVFSYAKDKEIYDRGFYFELDSLPFLFASTNEELYKNIMNFDQEKYQEGLKSFYKQIEMTMDGNASKRFVDYLIEKGIFGTAV